MSSFIEKRVQIWGQASARETNRRLQYLETKLYSTYECSLPPHPDFWTRIERWIRNANGDEKLEIELFNSVNELFYIGPDEFKELYRQAYNGPIARWLIELAGIDFKNIQIAQQNIAKEIAQSWFCPITDSFKISEFYHINGIPSPGSLRPDWRALSKLGDVDAIRKMLSSDGIKNVILLEDFVGGGTQIKPAIELAEKLTDIVNILVVPLITCPKGMQNLTRDLKSSPIGFETALPVPEITFLSKLKTKNEKEQHEILRQLATKTYMDVSGGQAPGATDSKNKVLPPFYPLGWKETGGLIIMHTNTPNNTLPLFHYESKSWKPIFPRHERT